MDKLRDLSGIRCLALSLLFCCTGTALATDARPNILLIVADDLGYSDLGCYGGEIETPHLDQMAARGVRMSHFRATPMCVTSRIALMSGMPMEQAGNHRYEHAVPLPVLLKQAGYRTMMTGKWHAGNPSPRSKALFDRAFGFLGGMSDCFVGGDDWFLDQRPFRNFTPGFYSTDAFAQRSVEFMQQAVEADQPFFMYTAFNAPHHPCQAPEATVRKYMHRYRVGYEATRQRRRERQTELGLIDPTWPMASLGGEVRNWDQLTPHRQTVEANRMAAYAAMVDELDSAVGKLLTYLRDAEIEDDTLVIFISDNGGDYSNGSVDRDEHQIAWQPGGNPSSSNGWAAVKATPFRLYKHACHEGGIAVPMIIQWPRYVDHAGGAILSQPVSITDIYPTLIKLAAIAYPDRYAGHANRSLTGSSLLPLLQQGGQRNRQPLFERYAFSRGWIEDERKAVQLYNGPWQLFDLRSDRGEVHDLAAEHPGELNQMISHWQAFAEAAGVSDVQSPADQQQRPWGWHRLQMICPSLVSLSPQSGQLIELQDLSPSLSFREPISFSGTESKTIRLYDRSDESQPVWQADFDSQHPAEGKREIVLTGLPKLQPGRSYYWLWDAGWLKVGGRPVGPLNDGAFWWRFRTATESSKPDRDGTRPSIRTSE